MTPTPVDQKYITFHMFLKYRQKILYNGSILVAANVKDGYLTSLDQKSQLCCYDPPGETMDFLESLNCFSSGREHLEHKTSSSGDSLCRVSELFILHVELTM